MNEGRNRAQPSKASTIRGLSNQIDFNKMIGPRVDFMNALAKYDFNKMIGPRVDFMNALAKIDLDKMIGPQIDASRMAAALDDRNVKSVMERIDQDSVYRLAGGHGFVGIGCPFAKRADNRVSARSCE